MTTVQYQIPIIPLITVNPNGEMLLLFFADFAGKQLLHYDRIAQHQEEEHKEVTSETKLKPNEIRCRDCPSSFGNKHGLIKHAMDVHVWPGEGRPVYACNGCDKKYRHEKDLMTHKERLCKAANVAKADLTQVQS